MAGGHGGKRPGAGRKPGLLWRGTAAVSEASRVQIEVLERDHGADPRGFLAGVMNDSEIDLPTRMNAAATLMPYIYPRLSAQAVVSTRVEATDPGALIQTINNRLARITTNSGFGGDDVRRDSRDSQAKTIDYEADTPSATISAHIYGIKTAQ
jgi:hypothetical protein